MSDPGWTGWPFTSTMRTCDRASFVLSSMVFQSPTGVS